MRYISRTRTVCLAMWFSIAISGASSRNEQKKEVLTEETGIAAVREVFEVNAVRPLERSTFELLRQYFSVRQQRKIDAFLRTLDRLIARRDRIAHQAGITENWWWPSHIDTDVHLIVKGDPLTNRAGTPDKISFGEPRRVNNRLEIVAKEIYIETALDGTDLGGTKTCNVILIPENHRWAIDEITFIIHQYGRVETTTLSQILQNNSNRLRKLEKRIRNMKSEIRRASPVTPRNERAK